ncbi:MAG: MarC family protein [Dehalococcoidia bacterium]|nr:MarC family protein [Dehalococcoidia bacterium]
MSDYLRLLLIFAVVINPLAVRVAFEPWRERLDRRELPAVAGVGAAVAAVLLGLAAVIAADLLDFLDVAPETFRIAAGIVMATSAVLAVWRGRAGATLVPGESRSWQAGVFPLGLPLLAGPAGLVAAMTYGIDDGEVKAWAAAVPWLAVGAALALVELTRWTAAADAVARVCGALLVVVSAGLIVEGVRDI